MGEAKAQGEILEILPADPAPVEVDGPTDWIAEQDRFARSERRLLVLNMCFSAGFHLVLLLALTIFFAAPQGRTDGLTEIELAAQVPKLGDENATDDGMPDQKQDARADAREITQTDLSLDEKTDQIEKSLDDISKKQDLELAEQRRREADMAKQEEGKRVRGIRSADARVGGNLSGREGIGKLKPRTFYGMKVHSRKMIFILDVSGSMNIRYAKMNLKNAYKTLGAKERFAIVCYDNRIFHWPSTKRLVFATKDNKGRADSWVDEVVDGGGATNIYDALKMAFSMCNKGESADTFYFLSDGYATHGVKDGDLILRAVKKWNERAKVIIHSIGLGRHDQRLMEGVAKQNRGIYKALPY